MKISEISNIQDLWVELIKSKMKLIDLEIAPVKAKVLAFEVDIENAQRSLLYFFLNRKGGVELYTTDRNAVMGEIDAELAKHSRYQDLLLSKGVAESDLTRLTAEREEIDNFKIPTFRETIDKMGE